MSTTSLAIVFSTAADAGVQILLRLKKVCQCLPSSCVLALVSPILSFFPHIFVWGSCFWFCIPPPPSAFSFHLRLPHTICSSHTTCPHTTCHHTTCPHTTCPHTTCHQTTCSHTACHHTSCHHTTCSHTLCSHTTCSHTTSHHTFAWQAWHVWHWAGSGGALGPEWPGMVPRLLAWQALHFETSTFVSRGRRGTW